MRNLRHFCLPASTAQNSHIDIIFMTFHILTIFPNIFSSYFGESILKRAQEKNKIKINIYDLREWTTDKHKTVDEAPYGGGAGMIMKVDILYRAIQDIKTKITNTRPAGPLRRRYSEASGQELQITNKSKIQKLKSETCEAKIILLSAKGKTWNQQLARKYTKLNDIILICGRYEGVDERITHFIDEEISIGNYILTGGEIPAMAIVDSITRLLPGVLGNPSSLDEESFSNSFKIQNSKFKICAEYPQYTRPEIFIDDTGQEYKIPDILLSGHHAKIKKWREQQMKKI